MERFEVKVEGQVCGTSSDDCLESGMMRMEQILEEEDSFQKLRHHHLL